MTPTLVDSPHEAGMTLFAGFDVTAVLGEGEDGAMIYEFTSHNGRAGNGRRAVRWLKEHYGTLDVLDPGERDSESFMFWAKMQAEGLVDTLYDEDREPITDNEDA